MADEVALLAAADLVLRTCRPQQFDQGPSAFRECIETVRVVEDGEAWKARFGSVEEFYAAHEGHHPVIRVYGDLRRDVLTGDSSRSPIGLSSSEKIARKRVELGL